MRLILILLSFFMLFSVAHAGTYYVDGAMANDAGNGTSWGTAKKYIMSGVNLISAAGDTLRIKTGTYSGANNYLQVVNGDPDGTSGSWITVRSDDGSGNYGTVLISGTTSVGGDLASGALVIADHEYPNGGVNYWKFEHLEFNAAAEGVAAFLGGTQSSPYNTNILVDSCIFRSATSGTPYGVIYMVGISYLEIKDSIVILQTALSTSGNVVAFTGSGQTEPDCTFQNRAWPTNISFHDNEVYGSGTHSVNYYGVIGLKRIINSSVYNNYVHDLTFTGGNGSFIWIRHGTGHNIYNNIFHINSGSSALSIFQVRGMTSEPQEGPCSAYQCDIYNNTIDLQNDVPDEIVHSSNDSTDTIFQNNLIIGTSPSLGAGYWPAEYCDECGSNTYPSGNVLRYNVFTGSGPSTWLESGIDGWSQSNNSVSQGTSFINLSGDKPYPYYGLSASKDGTSTSPVPATDYNGTSRSATPDVGAFEYGEEDTTAPVISTVTIGTNGTTLTVNWTEASSSVSRGGGWANSQMNVDCSTAGNDIGVTYVSGDASTAWTLTLASTINSGDTCNLDFDGGTTSIVDPSSNYVVDFSNQAVTNNSTQPAPSVVAGANTNIATNGTTVAVKFSETVVTTGYDNGDFNLDCTTAGTNISLNSISGSGDSRTFTAATTINYGDVCNLDYVGSANEIEDAGGNDLAGTLTDIAIVNNSTQGQDTTPPVVTISTSDPSNIINNSLSISGTASDAVGVTSCKFRIGAAPDGSNGTIIDGTTSWSGTATGFAEGANTLYVGCTDAAGNWGSDSITVNYTIIPAKVQGLTISGGVSFQ